MECQDGDFYNDIHSAFGQGRLGKALGYGTESSDLRAPSFESEDASSKHADAGTALRRHATDHMMAASSGENQTFENSAMAVSRFHACSQPTSHPSGKEPKPRIGHNKLPRPSYVTQELPTQAFSETRPGFPRSDTADDNLAAKTPWVVPRPPNASPADTVMDSYPLAGNTTFMIKNIPATYTQRKLLQEFTSEDFEGLIDFFYLPKGPSTRTNRGFAFCNLLDEQAAARFYNRFHGSMLEYSRDAVLLDITAAKIQGFEDNAKHFLFEKAQSNKSTDAYSRPMFLRPLPSHLQQRLTGPGVGKDNA